MVFPLFKKKHNWEQDDPGNPYETNPHATGTEWASFDTAKLKYAGPKEYYTDLDSITGAYLSRLAPVDMSRSLFAGIRPRVLTKDEFENFVAGKFAGSPLSRGKLALLTLEVELGAYFNCHSDSIYPETKESLKPQSISTDMDPIGFFLDRGYQLLDYKRPGIIPHGAVIAYFDGHNSDVGFSNHSARISHYSYDGIPLWQSKLGAGPRILHYLFDISCSRIGYGEVSHFFSHPNHKGFG